MQQMQKTHATHATSTISAERVAAKSIESIAHDRQRDKVAQERRQHDRNNASAILLLYIHMLQACTCIYVAAYV